MSVLSQEIDLEQPEPSRWRWAWWLIGIAPYATAVLFAAAAGLKIYHLRNGWFPSDELVQSRSFSTILLAMEVFLAALLTYSPTRRIGVKIAASILAAFIAYNLVNWSKGKMTCGCLGVIATDPAVMASIDTIFLLMLLLWNAKHSRVSLPPQYNRIGYGFPITLMVLIVAALGLTQKSSVSRVPHGIEVLPAILDLGEVDERTKKRGQVSIVNRRSSSVKIASIVPDCGCTVADVDRLELLPGERATLSITYSSDMPVTTKVERRVLVHLESAGDVEELVVSVIATIVGHTPIVLYPPLLDFGDVPAGTTAEKVLYFRGSNSALSSIPDELQIAIGPSSTKVAVEFGSVVRFPDTKEMLLRLTCSSTQPFGLSESVLEFADSKGRSPTISVPIRARVMPTRRASPTHLAVFVNRSTLVCQPARFSLYGVGEGEYKQLRFQHDQPIQIETLETGNPSGPNYIIWFTSDAFVSRSDRAGYIRIVFPNSSTLDIPLAIIFIDEIVSPSGGRPAINASDN